MTISQRTPISINWWSYYGPNWKFVNPFMPEDLLDRSLLDLKYFGIVGFLALVRSGMHSDHLARHEQTLCKPNQQALFKYQILFIQSITKLIIIKLIHKMFKSDVVFISLCGLARLTLITKLIIINFVIKLIHKMFKSDVVFISLCGLARLTLITKLIIINFVIKLVQNV